MCQGYYDRNHLARRIRSVDVGAVIIGACANSQTAVPVQWKRGTSLGGGEAFPSEATDASTDRERSD